jgi:hypothetical protein
VCGLMAGREDGCQDQEAAGYTVKGVRYASFISQHQGSGACTWYQ